MKRNRSFLNAFLSLVVACILSSAAAQAQADQADQDTASPSGRLSPVYDASVELHARSIETWKTGDVRFFYASEGFELSFSDRSLKSRQALCWFDEAQARTSKITVLAVYAAGGVVVSSPSAEVTSKKLFLVIRTKGALVVADEDDDIPLLDEPKDTELTRRAIEESDSFLIPDDMLPQREAAEEPAAEADALHIIRPEEETAVEAYSLHTRAFESGWYEDRDARYFIGGVNIIVRSEKLPAGQLELIAENMIVWGLGKLDETGDLSLAGLQFYAEGNVTFYQGDMQLKAQRFFYDAARNKALILDGELVAYVKNRDENKSEAVYIRAEKIQQAAAGYYVADGATATNDDYGRPNAWLQFGRLEYRQTDDRRTVQAVNTSAWAYGVPFFYWPYFSWDLDRDIIVKQLRVRNSTQYGTAIETRFDLYDTGAFDWIRVGPKGYQPSDFSDLSLDVDYYSKRGLGLGLGLEYDIRRDKPFEDWPVPILGSSYGYYIHDKAEEDSTGPLRNLPIPNPERGRFRTQNRAWLAEGLTFDTEMSYLSDAGLLAEYFEREYKEQKPQETLGYLKYQKDNWAATALEKVRVNDFQTEVEYLPRLGFNVFGQSDPWDVVTFYSTSEISNVRFSPARDSVLERHRVARIDSNNELDLPFHVPPLKVVPFVGARASYFDDTVDGDGEGRFIGSAGVRASAQYHRLYDCASPLLDVNGLRHIVTPDVEYVNAYVNTTDPDELFQIDDVDKAGEYEVLRFGVRQRLQTKRPGRAPTYVTAPRVIDWMFLDIEMDYFPEADRDNHGDSFSDLYLDYWWYVTDSVRFIADARFDVSNDVGISKGSTGFSIRRGPDLSFFVGNRFVRSADSHALTVSANYRLNSRWDVAVLAQYDFDAHQLIEERLIVRRRFHKWVLETTFELDEGQDNKTFTVSIYPEGITRRFFPSQLFSVSSELETQ